MSTKPRKILLVEDDDSHRQTLERHLLRSGYLVESVDCAEQALARFMAISPDLVISDVRMPGMSGFELMGHLLERIPGTVIVLITAFDDFQGAIDAMKSGAFDYMVKPLDLDRFDETVQRALREVAARRGAKSRDEESDYRGIGTLVGHNPRMLEVYKLIGSVSNTRATVLIRGETGTGKELIARTIHRNSAAENAPFIAVNCAAVPETLLEADLFGHVRGAFTGAVASHKGKFELASRGSIFLDEVGETTLAFQSKLLRVLQEKEFYPVGGDAPVRTNARVIAATNAPLEDMVRAGRFREDLYFRLRVIEIVVPPLRERRSDIPLLARHILERMSRELSQPVPALTDEALARLVRHDWPGNVRELENVLTRAAVLARGVAIGGEHLAFGPERAAETQPAAASDASLVAMEAAHVYTVLQRARGNKSHAARLLRISRPRLDRLIAKHRIAV